MDNVEAKSLGNLLQIIKEHFSIINCSNFGLYFRGQSSYDHQLIPSIFRQGKQFGGIKMNEREMLREFKLLKETQNNTSRSTVEWLLLMQHYGIPTRLLDWSHSLLVGLYFAVNERLDKDKDGALFVLEPISLNKTSDPPSGLSIFDHLNIQVMLRANLSNISKLPDFIKCKEIKDISNNQGWKLETTESKINCIKDATSNKFYSDWLQRTIETPIAMKSPIQNDRIYLQHGVFTIHGGKILGEDVIVNPTHIEDVEDINLLKIKIPLESKPSFKEELGYCGVNESTLFPELEHQSHYIREHWTSKT